MADLKGVPKLTGPAKPADPKQTDGTSAPKPAAKPVGDPASWLPPSDGNDAVCHDFSSSYLAVTAHPTKEGILAHRHDQGVASGMNYPNEKDAAADRNGELLVWDESGKVLLEVPEAELPADVRAEYTAPSKGLGVTVVNCRDFGRAQDVLELCNHSMMAGTAKRLDGPPVPNAELGTLDEKFEHYEVATDSDFQRQAYSINGRLYMRERTFSTHQDTWYDIGEDHGAQPPIPAYHGP
jgi:hypothetical protein